jgi:hypothetical protein
MVSLLKMSTSRPVGPQDQVHERLFLLFDAMALYLLPGRFMALSNYLVIGVSPFF